MQELHKNRTKRLHKFHEHRFFINCKNPCRFRNTVSKKVFFSLPRQSHPSRYYLANIFETPYQASFMLRTKSLFVMDFNTRQMQMMKSYLEIMSKMSIVTSLKQFREIPARYQLFFGFQFFWPIGKS